MSTYELVGWRKDHFENSEPSYRHLMDVIRSETDCLYMCVTFQPNEKNRMEYPLLSSNTGGFCASCALPEALLHLAEVLHMCDVPVPNVRTGEHDVIVDQWDEDDQHITRRTIRTRDRTLTTVTSHADAVKTVWTREHPVKDLDDLAAYLDLPWEPGEPEFRRLHQARTDLDARHGLPLISIGDPICELAAAFEFGNFTVQAITETRAILAALDRLHERCRERLRRVLRGPVRNAVFRICGPEYATPPYLPPELFRLFVTRYDSEYVRMIQEAERLPESIRTEKSPVSSTKSTR